MENNFGNVVTAVNNFVKNHGLNRNESGKSSPVANKVMLTSQRSTDAVPNGCNDN
jgi:hypothetical protein